MTSGFIRLLPLAGLVVSYLAVFQWGKSSAALEGVEADKAAIIASLDGQISTLNDRVQMREARAVVDAEMVSRIDAILNDYTPEPIYVTPPAPDCPAPVYSTVRVRDIAGAVNTALSGTLPPSVGPDGASGASTGLPSADDRPTDADSP